MGDFKGILQSRTVWAVIVGLLATLASHLHFTVTDADQAAFIDNGIVFVQAISGIAAIVFRISATKVVKPFAKG